MWRFLRSSNIVRFIGVSTTIDVCLVSEWMPHGTVTAYLIQYADADRIKIVSGILSRNV